MKLFPLLLGAATVLSGCQTMPDTADTTNARLRFRIHYDTPGLTTPSVEITTESSIQANRCIYVNEPFGVVANVADSGGIRSIVIGPSQFFDAVTVRKNAGDIVAIPGPAETTQTVSGVTFPNPGSRPGSPAAQVVYSTAKAFDSVTLLTMYDFTGGSRAAMRATARNWGATTGVSEVYHFHVQKAEPGNPARQAGMNCPLPPA